MKRSGWGLVLLGALVGLSLMGDMGCRPDCDSHDADGGAGGSVGVGECDPGPNAKITDKFPDWGTHWIVIDENKDGVCEVLPPAPALPEWLGRRLFEGDIGGVPVGGELSTYCAYQWLDPDPNDPTNQPDTSSLPPVRTPDLRAVIPQSDSVGKWARSAFLQGIQSSPKAPEDPDPRVRVFVWDTAEYLVEKDSELPSGTNVHGRVMADLVQEVACPPSGKCAVQVETWMAMPRRRNDEGMEMLVKDGGDFGRLSDLPVAISRSLERWREDLTNNQAAFPETLVGTLSLAFDVEKSKDDPPTEADLAILKALRGASCHEVVMFAASGNHAGGRLGPLRKGLPYPAHWQDEPQPTEEECNDILGEEFMTALRDAYLLRTGQPLRRTYSGVPYLVHAAGGLDQGGKIITTSREDACPRLAAQGFAWAAPEEAEQLFTGSSVPAALIAAITGAKVAQSAQVYEHPQTFLDDLVAASPLVMFEAKVPCGVPWTCGAVPWIGGSMAETGGLQNPQEGFPWLDYETALPEDSTISQQDLCGKEPLCLAPPRPPAASNANIHPQPDVIPCSRPCVVQMPFGKDVSNPPEFYVNPTMDLTYAKLRIEDDISKQGIVFTIAGSTAVLKKGTNYRFKLDPAALGDLDLSSARVTFSALTTSAATSVIDQVLIVK